MLNTRQKIYLICIGIILTNSLSVFAQEGNPNSNSSNHELQSFETQSSMKQKPTDFSIFTRYAVMVFNDVGDTAVISDFTGTHYGKGYFLTINASPFNFHIGDDGYKLSLGLSLEGGYNGRILALGAGFGIREIVTYWGIEEPNLAVSIPLRIGKLNGLNFNSNVGFVYNMETGFRWSDARARMKVPLTQRVSLFLEGIGAREEIWGDDTGYAAGSIGAVIRLKGDGGRSTLNLTGAVGAAGLWTVNEIMSFSMSNEPDGIVEDESSYQEVSFSVGPMVSLCVTWLF